MSLYRYRITPTSAFATPLRSDTLYGHLLWRAAERDGTEKVKKLIESFAGKTPPFKLSSAFPQDCLPLPSLAPIPRQRFRERFAPDGGKQLVDQLQLYKQFRKLKYLKVDILRQLVGGLCQEKLFAQWLKQPEQFGPSAEITKTATQPHNSIDRSSGKVMAEGGLHFGSATWYSLGFALDLYVETDQLELFDRLMCDLQRSGYGADSSTGKGQFEFSRDESFDPEQWPQTGNARLLLSLTAAENMQAFFGSYQPQVKRGRAWSGFGEQNPFKKPFLALSEGSVLTAMPEEGFVLRNIHSNPDIVQVLWPLTLPLTLEVAHEK
jgi:CRISPR-associated protein Csm4